MEDKELIASCRRGDPKGQQILYQRNFAMCSRLCLRYLQNEGEAMEALTRGFLQVFRKINDFSYQGNGSLEAWIRKIMTNESLQCLRSRKRLQVNTDLSHAENEVLEIDSEMDAEYLYEAIKGLPDGFRTVFNLYVIEGYSHKEIGKMLDITESSSRSQLNRAKMKLREYLKTDSQ